MNRVVHRGAPRSRRPGCRQSIAMPATAPRGPGTDYQSTTSSDSHWCSRSTGYTPSSRRGGHVRQLIVVVRDPRGAGVSVRSHGRTARCWANRWRWSTTKSSITGWWLRGRRVCRPLSCRSTQYRPSRLRPLTLIAQQPHTSSRQERRKGQC